MGDVLREANKRISEEARPKKQPLSHFADAARRAVEWIRRGCHDAPTLRGKFLMDRFPCPYFQAEIELTDERRQHVLTSHPEFGSDLLDKIRQTLADPDEVRTDRRLPATWLVSRWFDDLLEGKIMVVAVVADEPRPDDLVLFDIGLSLLTPRAA